MRQPQAGARGVAAGRRCRSRLRQAAWEKGVDLPPAPHLSGKTAAQHPRGVHVGPPTPPAQRRVCARRWHGCARRQRRRDPAATKTRHTGCVCGRVRSPPSVAAGEGDTHGCRELQPNQNKRPRREQRAARSTSECAATRFPTKTRPHRHRQRHWPTYLSVAAATGKEEATQVATGGAGGLPTRLEIGGQEQPKEARGRAHRQHQTARDQSLENGGGSAPSSPPSAARGPAGALPSGRSQGARRADQSARGMGCRLAGLVQQGGGGGRAAGRRRAQRHRAATWPRLGGRSPRQTGGRQPWTHVMLSHTLCATALTSLRRVLLVC